MNLESRISRLENRIGVRDEIPPMVVITVSDQSKNSTDQGTPTIAIVPGQIGSPGFSLTRAETETPADFLRRCNAKHSEIYG